jgi:hypothetical protein
MVVCGPSLRVVACRAECSCGRRAACQQLRFGGSEFDAGDGNPARDYSDSATKHRHAPGWNGNASGQHRDAASPTKSEYAGLELNQWNDTEEHDSRNRAGLELARQSDSWKQYTAVNGKSKYPEQSGNNAQRSSVRSLARNAGNARRLKSKFRVEPGLLQFRIFNFADNSGQQFG